MKDRQHHIELLSNLRSLKREELEKREQDLQNELFWLGFKHRSGQLSTSSDLGKTRRMLARVKTLLKETKPS